MANREDTLSRIRTALGPGRGNVTPLDRLPRPASTAPLDQLRDQFMEELLKVGGNVECVAGSHLLPEHLEEFLKARGASGIAISDGVEALAPGLRKRLSAQGVRLIPSLREFSLPPASSESPAEAYKQALMGSDAGVTTADYAIADTGTLVLVSGGEQHRLISLAPPLHVCILKRSSVLANLAELISRVNDGPYSQARPPLVMTFITGPSRTGDIELTLTMGVHGPRELHVVIYP